MAQEADVASRCREDWDFGGWLKFSRGNNWASTKTRDTAQRERLLRSSSSLLEKMMEEKFMNSGYAKCGK